MEALKFRLRGKHAFFKIPEVNTIYYFTYGQIHKVALLGMFGAILGYQGYGQKYEVFPEFYNKLEQIKISVLPESPNGYFTKKIQVFNNSVGYASQETGGNLVVKEQWLEEPSWMIYVLLQGEESQKIADAVLHGKCEYIPYLGKNDHPADILDAEMIHVKEIEKDSPIRIHSLFPSEKVMLDEEDSYNFKYEERLPFAMKETTNQYITEKFAFTDGIVESNQTPIYLAEDKYIVFY